MSDPTPNPPNPEGGNTPSGDTPPAGGGFQPITTQADLDRIIGQRVERERAKYADYGDVKARAAKADEAEALVNEKVKEVEAALAGIPTQVTEALRTHLVSLHKIGDEDASLFLTASDPETLLKQVERLSSHTPGGNHVPREGKKPRPGAGSSWDSVLSELDRQRQN